VSGGSGPFGFLRASTPAQRKTLAAASLGWMLDSMDTMLYALVLPLLLAELSLSQATGGLLQSLTQLTGAVGGVAFGVLADRLGRTRALVGSVLLYSLGTAASGLTGTVWQLAACRALLGLGMGGEWATGAALVSETWPAEHRGKALALVQSSWAVGYALAAGIVALVVPAWGWRAAFFVGLLPAVFAVWVARAVPEPERWRRVALQGKADAAGRGTLLALLRPPLLGRAAIATAVNAATLFAWWGLFTWIPSYLALPPERGGAGLSVVRTSTWVALMQVGMWLGYVSFGFICDRFGRRITYVGFLLSAAVLVPIYGHVRDPRALLWLGPLVAFFGTGYFSGFGVVTAELFPTRVRATAQGTTYNVGRALSATAPYLVGSVAQTRGLGFAFYLVAAAFLLAAALATRFPETRGKELED
jgi:MFS family permease